MALAKGSENAFWQQECKDHKQAGLSCSGNLRALLTYVGEKDQRVQRSPGAGTWWYGVSGWQVVGPHTFFFLF